MRLLPTDPDIQTLVARIKNGDLNLQPDFQRGEVWSEAKKRRLIDSVLRDWHVPPIHVVEVKETGAQEVLDGQQRLVAIRDFAADRLTIDGYTQPRDPEIEKLHGFTYKQLPSLYRRRFDQFTIRMFRITDYNPGEPGELFYRLNQPTNLTPAEQRNAFFGPARQQVKELVHQFVDVGLTEDALGFSNSRMAYDDVIARFCLTLSNGALREQIAATRVTDKYRSPDGFSDETVARAHDALILLGQSRIEIPHTIKFNKTTLYSWLCFIAALQAPVPIIIAPRILGSYISEFEHRRLLLKGERTSMQDEHLLRLFNDRASSRVADVTSVLTRDVILWIFFLFYATRTGLHLPTHHPRIQIVYKWVPQRSSDLNEFVTSAEQLVDSIILDHWGAL